MAAQCTCSTLSAGPTSAQLQATSAGFVCENTLYAAFHGSSEGGSLGIDREVNFLWGGCSFWSTPALVGLAQAIQEHGTSGLGNNWLQVEPGTISSFVADVITPNNKTPESFISSYAMTFDAINAQVAMWSLHNNLSYYAGQGYSGHDQLLFALNGYNRGPSDAHLNQAYGASVLWKAYGDAWSTASGTSWNGAYMAAGPTSDTVQCALASPNPGVTKTPKGYATPGFPVPSTKYLSPWGTNTNNKAVVLFVAPGDEEKYVAGIFVEQWLAQNNKVGIMLTSAEEFSAHTASQSVSSGHDLLVIALGSDAATDLQDQDSSLQEFSSITDWENSASAGFVYVSDYSACITLLSASAADPYLAA